MFVLPFFLGLSAFSIGLPYLAWQALYRQLGLPLPYPKLRHDPSTIAFTKAGIGFIIGMETFSGLGKLLVILGGVLILVGLGLWGKLPFLGRLPGDIRVERDGFVFYFPLTTMLVISAIVSLILFAWSPVNGQSTASFQEYRESPVDEAVA